MTKQVQRRRGTATQHTSFTGAEGEISVNTTNKSIHVHDGVTAGGVEAARADMTNVSDANLNARLNGNTLSSLTITSADINGGTIDGTVIGGTTPAAGSFTQVNLGDNNKAIFGAGSDLQIYHDGLNSYIDDQGTGRIIIKGNDDVRIRSGANEEMIVASSDGAVTLYHNAFPKLATTSTGVDVTGTVTADGLTVDGNITSTGGDLNLATLDLNAIAASKAVTAVDVFVYDTSKDSDGGAWRKRTQHTSWYNETLNTATRGSRREFPAVAVIVAEATKVTIYDGDDPALPMWMVFDCADGNDMLRGIATNAITSIAMLNGTLSVCGQSAGFIRVNYLSEYSDMVDNSRQLVYLGSIADRNSASGFSANTGNSSSYIVSYFINDVAMTVLPDAPIDPATGLPVPTIAVATAGGVSVIKDDGTVASDSQPVSVQRIGISGSDLFSYVQTSTGYVAVRRNFYTRTGVSIDNFGLSSGGEVFYRHNSVPALFPIQANNAILKFDSKDFGFNQGLFRLHEDQNTPSNSMVAYTTSTYNTGWMNGDIKGAFLSSTDATSLVGSGELVTNGTFDTDVSGWTAARSATLTWVSGAMQISYGGTDYPQAQQTLTTVAGQRYKLQLTQTAGVSLSAVVGTAAGGNQLGSVGGTGSLTLDFVASSTTSYLTLQANSVGAISVTVDNVSVKLADADRSVNNNGLIVNGTVTRSAVATGAELVAYSGFSASNYLEQPYNSALDFGTGDFCVMGWVKGAASSQQILHRSLASSAGGILLQTDVNGNLVVYLSASTSFSYTTVSSKPILNGTWNLFSVRRLSGVLYLDVNGLNTATVPNTTDITYVSAVTKVGRRNDVATFFNGSLALLRISATAPTAEAIKKIYNDEKVLFQDNAACTLYGASDAVTALAHDQELNLLHVGTSAGRSVFQGLRRVSNTTTAVGTAISASGGMVAEE